MDDQVLPPYADPTGPLNDDKAVVHAFLQRVYVGHSSRFHVEDDALVVDRDVTAALRIGPATILVRIDPPDEQLDAKAIVEAVLTAEGYRCFDEDTLLAAPIAIQVLGLRISSWDLWGREIEEAFNTLRAAAAGEELNTIW